MGDLWVKKNGEFYKVGLSLDVLEKFRERTFIELPEVGEIKAGDPFLHVETTKVAHELSSPISGKIREVNEAFLDHQHIGEKENWIAVFDTVEEAEM